MEILALLEVLDRDGSVRRHLEVRHWPVSIGRDMHCDLVLDDLHIAAEHARISMQQEQGEDSPGQLWLTVGQSINGVQTQGQHLDAGQACVLHSGDEWQIGRTRMRLRLAGAPLAPEQALPQVHGTPPWVLIPGLLALLVWTAGDAFVRSNPDGFGSTFLREFITLWGALAVWAVLWSLLTKIFQHRMNFWHHVGLAALAVLAANMSSLLLSMLAYASSVEVLGRLDALMISVLAAVLIYAHLLAVQPQRRKTLRWFAGSMCVLMLIASVGLSWHRFERISSELYLSTFFPPALSLSHSVSVDLFLDEAKDLQAPLERKAKEPPSGFSRGAAAADDDG